MTEPTIDLGKSVYAPIATQKQVLAAVRNYFRGELLNRANESDGGNNTNGMGWLKAEVKEAVKVVAIADKGLIETSVRNQINALLGGRFARDEMAKLVAAEITKQVTAMVKENLIIHASMKLDVTPVSVPDYEAKAQF